MRGDHYFVFALLMYGYARTDYVSSDDGTLEGFNSNEAAAGWWDSSDASGQGDDNNLDLSMENASVDPVDDHLDLPVMVGNGLIDPNDDSTDTTTTPLLADSLGGVCTNENQSPSPSSRIRRARSAVYCTTDDGTNLDLPDGTRGNLDRATQLNLPDVSMYVGWVAFRLVSSISSLTD